MKSMVRKENRAGFTLAELLAVIGVVALLFALLLPALSVARERSRRIACMSNVRQLAMGMLLYAEDDARGSLSGKTHSEDQDLNWLANGYAEERRLYVCPSTKNIVSAARDRHRISGVEGYADLRDVSKSAGPVKGMSYQPFGFMGVDVEVWSEIPHYPHMEFINGVRNPYYGRLMPINGVRKDLKNIHTSKHQPDSFGLRGVVTGPSRIWIIADTGINRGKLYWPDGADNHGASGAHVGHADGHADWVRREDYIYRYEMSQDEGRTGIAIPWL